MCSQKTRKAMSSLRKPPPPLLLLLPPNRKLPRGTSLCDSKNAKKKLKEMGLPALKPPPKWKMELQQNPTKLPTDQAVLQALLQKSRKSQKSLANRGNQ